MIVIRTNFKLFASILLLLASSPVFAEITQVDNNTLENLRAKGVAIIDVRRQDEWEATGLVEGSHPLTFFDAQGRYDANAWLEKLADIVKSDEPVVLICARGVRTSKIAALLDKRLGFTQVHNVTDGINSWIAEKRPVSEYKP